MTTFLIVSTALTLALAAWFIRDIRKRRAESRRQAAIEERARRRRADPMWMPDVITPDDPEWALLNRAANNGGRPVFGRWDPATQQWVDITDLPEEER